MKYFQLLVFYFFLISNVVAEPALSRGGPPNLVPPQERRGELRSVLKEGKGSQAQASTHGAESADWPRRLSEQERIDLRNQLRWQRREVAPSTP